MSFKLCIMNPCNDSYHACREDALKPNTNALCRYLFLNSLCTNSDSTQLTESLELPSWVKAVVPSKTSTDEDDNEEDDDFVIPSLAHWVESPSRKLVVELEAREQLFNKTIESDIDKLSNVLNKRYASPRKVAQELDGCGDLNLSGSFDLGRNTNRRLARAHLYEEAIAAFKGMERLGISKDVSGTVNTTSFNILVRGWCKVRMFDTARKVMEDMEKNGYQLNAFTYTCFVESYCREKDFRNVDGILDEMKAKD
ncbi:hypothetical protein F8388_020964 [Cannabis sativa]|uniref:Pentatricopeptide repeat-containing protein n=1 Tax=Cannabis sativa TaxID=3483 RepID=A0A7J6FKS9_CANSA|nr:hypothetical protein F8388_020964 [Cannabis sativa]